MSRTIEFETELTGGNTLALPPGIASTLPSRGKATVVVFVDMDADQSDWHEFVQRTYGSCAGLGLEEPDDLPLSEGNVQA